MKNRILPKVISNKLSQFEQKASVLVPPEKWDVWDFLCIFLRKIDHMHCYAKKSVRDWFLKNVVLHTNILKMLGFYSMYFWIFCLKKIKVAMFSAFHIGQVRNAIRKNVAPEHYSLVNLEFIKKSFLRCFSTFEGLFRVQKSIFRKNYVPTLHVSKPSKFVGNSCMYFFWLIKAQLIKK